MSTWARPGRRLAREVLEETGLTIDPQEIRDFRVLSAPDGTILIFGLAKRRTLAELPPLQASDEASECVMGRADTEIAFELHQQVAREFFSRRTVV